MKSNEEFIAGIYEKAAAYTEEKEITTVKTYRTAKITRIAAMAAVCIGLAGIGSLVLGRESNQNPNNGLEQASEEYGIAMLSENGEELSGAAQFRMMPVAETVTFTGVVEEISAEEKRIFLRLEFDETAPENTEGSIVCIKWDLTEKIGEEIADGTRLTATGALSMYENEDSEHNGCAELVLTDMANLEIR